jgi:hypothetical protein
MPLPDIIIELLQDGVGVDQGLGECDLIPDRMVLSQELSGLQLSLL